MCHNITSSHNLKNSSCYCIQNFNFHLFTKRHRSILLEKMSRPEYQAPPEIVSNQQLHLTVETHIVAF